MLFLRKHILQPLTQRWFVGTLVLIFWTIAFVALPALSGWFLAASSVAFLTANTLFAYLIPSSIIRLMTIMRTASRYFERLENHKTTLDAQKRLQLAVFQSVAQMPYFKKQVNSNSAILENSTHGIDLILNHIILWILPFAALIFSVILYFTFLAIFAQPIAIEFIVSSALLLFVMPQFVFFKNKKLYAQLKLLRDDNNQALIQSFRGRIEISKYQLEQKAINQYTHRILQTERIENKLQNNSFSLQLMAGLGYSLIAIFTLWNASNHTIDASLAIGIFFGIMAQAELAEMLFSGKSERNSVKEHVSDLNSIIEQGKAETKNDKMQSEIKVWVIKDVSAKIPDTTITTQPLTFELKKGKLIAIFGETGKGKTTFLNSLFYPEYRLSGSIILNNDIEIPTLPVPECIYVTQKAYLLTGTLRENFEGFADEAVVDILNKVDLGSWYQNLPNGLNTWIGENGETLSGGQRKKLLLAQALLKKPQLLVVDEPTAGISSENALTLFSSIKQNYPEMTILMATHQQLFEKMADKVVRL